MKIKIRIDVEAEDIPVRGNLIASGDTKFDTQCEDEVLARLAKDDEWAWCAVTVSATAGEFTGKNTLGGCSYLNEEDFKKGGYYEQMVDEAVSDLRAVLMAAANRGLAATQVLDKLNSEATEREES